MPTSATPIVLLAGEDLLATTIERKLKDAGAVVRRAVVRENRPLEVTSDELASAHVLVLAGDDDAGNVDAALSVRTQRPSLALVVRVFDSVLAAYLERTLHHCSILSVSALVAPHFARAATQAMKEAAEKLHGAGAVAAGPLPRRRSVARARPDRVLLGVLCGLLGLVAVATPFFAVTLKLSLLDAFYFVWTTITTVGYGDISLREATALAKLVGVVLMFGGAAFVAVIFSFFTDWTITRRLDVLRGRVRVRGHGHVVIVGAGHVGVRVAALMRTAGHRVVVVERDGEGRHVADLRAQGHHVLVADATSEEALALAGVDRASAVLALTEGEATNLHVVLLARAMRPELALVMKTVSPQLSAHVSGRGDAIAISPVATAADQFVQAALGEI